MEFTNIWPERWGYYWLIDITYPVPIIAYVDNKYAHSLHAKTYERYKWEKHIKFGDAIKIPKNIKY